jgi:hypothetical protein
MKNGASALKALCCRQHRGRRPVRPAAEHARNQQYCHPEVGDLTVNTYHPYVAFNVGAPDARVRRYVMVGFGATNYGGVDFTRVDGTQDTTTSETQFSTTWGAGVKVIMRCIDIILPVLAAAMLVWPAPGAAVQKPVSQGAQVSETATIEAIDYSARLVTLKDSTGETETVYCGPEVERFSPLKVGDKVTFRYYESVVYAIRRPGSAPVGSGGAGVTRTPGDRPGATISQQVTAVVTINAIDAKVPP